VQKKPVRRAEAGSTVQELQPFELYPAQDLPGVPVLAETILRLDLLVQERSIDLQAMADVVLSDLGATVTVLRLAAEEHGDAPNRPTRIADCIAELGAVACMDAIAALPVARDSRYLAITETWTHAREVAQQARLVAEDTPDVNPDEAHLVGLLHAIGLLPPVLGPAWAGLGGSRKSFSAALAGLQMAKQWSLPQSVVDYFREIQLETSNTPWAEIVHKAHRLANRSSILCPLEQGVRPLLYRAV